MLVVARSSARQLSGSSRATTLIVGGSWPPLSPLTDLSCDAVRTLRHHEGPCVGALFQRLLEGLRDLWAPAIGPSAREFPRGSTVCLKIRRRPSLVTTSTSMPASPPRPSRTRTVQRSPSGGRAEPLGDTATTSGPCAGRPDEDAIAAADVTELFEDSLRWARRRRARTATGSCGPVCGLVILSRGGQRVTRRSGTVGGQRVWQLIPREPWKWRWIWDLGESASVVMMSRATPRIQTSSARLVTAVKWLHSALRTNRLSAERSHGRAFYCPATA